MGNDYLNHACRRLHVDMFAMKITLNSHIHDDAA